MINAEEIYSIAQVAYTNGALTDLELKEIQFSVIQTKNRQLASTLALQTAVLDISLLTGDFRRLM